MKIKVGITATGRIADSFLKAIAQNEHYQVTAIMSRSIDSAKKFAEKNQIKQYYDNINDLCNADVDLIYVNSPNGLHYIQAKKALESKKHVLVEKCATTDNQELLELIDLAKVNNVTLMEGIVTMYMPILKELKNDILSLGNVLDVHFNLSNYFDLTFSNGELLPKFINNLGGGATFGIGSYICYPTLYLFGKPKKIIKIPHLKDYGQGQIDEFTTIDFYYENFKVNSILSLRNYSSKKQEIICERGTIVCDSINSIRTYTVYNIKGEEIKTVNNQMTHRMEYQLIDLYNSIKNQANVVNEKLMINVNEILVD